jgi:hypothetical protein
LLEQVLTSRFTVDSSAIGTENETAWKIANDSLLCH